MKHAYLIVAHNEFTILEKLLKLLDDPRNDFYIHIDKKVKDFPFEKYRDLVKYSGVHFIERMDIRWGDYSMIQAELQLLKAAVKGNYRYYHLLSGVDLPLRSNDEIHGFFAANDGKELVHFCPIEGDKERLMRVERLHFMRLRSSKHWLTRKLGTAADLAAECLYRFGIRRKWDESKTFAFGANWFSITHGLAAYVLEKEHWIRKRFRWSACADELFLQTIVANSPFDGKLYWPNKDNDNRANMRCIDWSRSNGRNPWIFRSQDLTMLLQSPCLFARKFSTQVDAQVVEDLYQHVRAKNERR